MFNCDKCGETSKARVSPIMVEMESEEHEYSFKDIEGNEKIAVGSQIVSEEKWCGRCAGAERVPFDDQGAAEVNRRGAMAAFGHLGRCNKGKKDDTCKVCEQCQRFFALLPLHHLSDAMNEVPAIPATFSLGTLILESTFIRGCDKGSRALRDKAAGMQLLRYYEKELGGRLNQNTH